MSIQVGRIKGIPIRLHFTLLLVSSLTTWILTATFMPELYPGLNVSAYWIMGIGGSIILIVSVLLHELAHSFVAQMYGLKVREIVLYIFGGVSVIENQDELASKDFRKELKIAAVGPLTSFVIAAILSVSFFLISSTGYTVMDANTSHISGTRYVQDTIVLGVLQYGALVNIVVGGFNLIPAFPCDGGRILRTLLLRSKNDFDKSTKITIRIGIAVSYGFIGLGFFTIIFGSYISGFWILLIGWFLYSAARAYLQQHHTKRYENILG